MQGYRLIIWLVMLAATPLQAEEVQSLQAIRDTVQRYVELSVAAEQGEVAVTVGALDNRLRLASCEVPLEPYLPNPSSRLVGSITVGVRCEGAKPWSLLVPTRVEQFLEVVAAARPLARNSTLQQGDITLVRSDVSRLGGGYFVSLEEARGQLLTRSVTSGTLLTRSMVKPVMWVKRGEKVVIEAKLGSISVNMEGKAQGSGAQGAVIGVTNNSSGRTIEAEVVAPGVVRVRM